MASSLPFSNHSNWPTRKAAHVNSMETIRRHLQHNAEAAKKKWSNTKAHKILDTILAEQNQVINAALDTINSFKTDSPTPKEMAALGKSLDNMFEFLTETEITGDAHKTLIILREWAGRLGLEGVMLESDVVPRGMTITEAEMSTRQLIARIQLGIKDIVEDMQEEELEGARFGSKTTPREKMRERDLFGE